MKVCQSLLALTNSFAVLCIAIAKGLDPCPGEVYFLIMVDAFTPSGWRSIWGSTTLQAAIAILLAYCPRYIFTTHELLDVTHHYLIIWPQMGWQSGLFTFKQSMLK